MFPCKSVVKPQRKLPMSKHVRDLLFEFEVQR
ncbi:MAG: hypothetical protein ACJAYV_000749, partial [Oleispira sp.]